MRLPRAGANPRAPGQCAREGLAAPREPLDLAQDGPVRLEEVVAGERPRLRPGDLGDADGRGLDALGERAGVEHEIDLEGGIAVSVAEEDASDVDVAAELLADLPRERVRVALPRLDLAPRELPLAGRARPVGAARDEEGPVPHHHRRDHPDPPHGKAPRQATSRAKRSPPLVRT